MSVDKVNKAAGGTGTNGTAIAQQAKPEDGKFGSMMAQLKSQVELALPKHLSADRMARIALTAFRQNKQLQECDPVSVFASVVAAAQLGLEPGVMGQCYLIPYKDRQRGPICTLVPGWRGLMDIANRSGRSSAWTNAVYPGDHFAYQYGSDPKIDHHDRNRATDDEGSITHFYAVGRIKGAEYPIIEVWSQSKVWKHRAKYNKVGDRHYSFRHPEMYGRKIPLLQVLKYLPTSIEMQVALDVEYGAQAGQTIDLERAATGDFVQTGDFNRDIDAGQRFTSKEEAVQAVKAIGKVEELDEVMNAVAASFDGEIPIEVDAAANDKREALMQDKGGKL